MWANLGDYDSGDALRREVCLDPVIAAWQMNSGPLTLFLDALDEGHLAIKPLANLLAA